MHRAGEEGANCKTNSIKSFKIMSLGFFAMRGDDEKATMSATLQNLG